MSIPSFVPVTTARLTPYVRLYSPGPMISSDTTSVSTKNMSKLATITSLDIKMDRPTDLWRQLDLDSGGMPQEVYPKLPSYSGTINKMILYKRPSDSVPGSSTADNIMALFGYDAYNYGFDILSQNKPLLLAFELPVKDANGNLTEDGSLLLACQNVWFENFPLRFDLEGNDLTLRQAVNFTFSRIIVTKQ